MTCLVLVRDLMFSSRIISAARDANVDATVVRDVSKLVDAVGDRLIVDLGQDGFLEAAAKWKVATGGELIGFVGHVDTDTIDRAKAANVDRVLTRGQFTQLLPSLFQT